MLFDWGSAYPYVFVIVASEFDMNYGMIHAHIYVSTQLDI